MRKLKKAKLVPIGNSRGIRIPKAWIEQLDLGEEVELSIDSDRLVIRSPHRPRQGWEEQFRISLDQEKELPLEQFPPTSWDLTEWEW